MSPRMRSFAAEQAVAALVVVGIVALGAWLRLAEPLSSPALGAEDPYTHVVFTKEALERGRFGDSVWLGTGMYPPGLHALLGALAPLSGVDLYDWARFAPVAFGALAVFGTYVLASRLGGRAAGVVAALLAAIIPEHVFRTNLLFPTALDLALLPAFLLAFHLAVVHQRASEHPFARERWPAMLLFAVMVPPMAFTHPWVVPLFLAPALVYAALRALRAGGGPRLVARRLVAPSALFVAAVAFAMASRWDKSDTGFADFLAHVPGLGWVGGLTLHPVLLFALLLPILGAMVAAGVGVAAAMSLARPRSRVLRLALAAALAAALLAALPALTRDPPPGVQYHHMLGTVGIWLGLAGLVLAAVRPSPLGDLAASIAVLLFPLTAINFFDSPFWPQRTVAYLTFGVALLAGHAAGVARTAALSRVRRPSLRRTLAPVALAGMLLLAGGAAAANPAKTYDWYRLYDDDDFRVFQDVAALAQKDPGARVFVHGWQSGLMLKTLGDPDQVWYSPKFYNDPARRDSQLGSVQGPAYLVVDAYVHKAVEKGKADLSFLDGGDWRLAASSPDGGVRIYQWEGDDE